jgi:hypothetical protein
VYLGGVVAVIGIVVYRMKVRVVILNIRVGVRVKRVGVSVL